MLLPAAKSMIPGPAGQIELVCDIPAQPGRHVAVVCHPHPQYGGTLTNKVVHTLARAFNAMGVTAVRFNFRGVGGSEGEYDAARGEVDDLLAVVDWVRHEQPDAIVTLAGFSFGAYIALAAQPQVQPFRLVTVAPAVNILDFTHIRAPECRWLLLQGEVDELVPPGLVRDWALQHREQVELVMVPDAGHFFHARLNLLQSLLEEKLGSDYR